MRRARLAAAAALGSLALAPGAAAQEPPRIADGISSAGVDLSGLSVPEAAAKLRQELRPRLVMPITVRVAGRRRQLSMHRIGQRLDAPRTARRALKAGRLGQAPGDVLPALSFRRAAVRAFVRRLAREVLRPARNATLRITLRRMIRKRSYKGRRLLQNELGGRLLRTIRNPRKPRSVKGRRRAFRAAITYRGLARLYRTVVTIDRRGYRLRLFKRLRYDRGYGIAVGAAGFDTPSGLFRITSRQVNPPWHAPNRPWAGSYAGKTVPGGAPDNPLKARWLGITASVGIHGTGEPWSIGTRASHGCIRMRVHDVIELYPRVPLGTRVLIR
jgi:L,D-transpeptidase catalytic domain/Putative peptidoglycan binding domain